MAPDAVPMDNFLPGFLNENHLWFQPEGEHGGMPQPVFCLEIILVENIVVRDMAIVAVCSLTMGTVIPGCVLGSHDVTVDAGAGIIPEI